jgi:hypothetical protein
MNFEILNTIEMLNTIETSAFTRVLNKLDREMQQVDLSINKSSKNIPARSKSGFPSLRLRCHEPRTTRKEGLEISPVRKERDRKKDREKERDHVFKLLRIRVLHSAQNLFLSITIVVSSFCSSATASVSVGQRTKGFFVQHLVSNISPKCGS